MASRGGKIIRIGTGRKCTNNIWYEESDSFDTNEGDKMDGTSPVIVKDNVKRGTKGRRRGRRPRAQKPVQPEPKAGPSESTPQEHGDGPIIEENDFMVVCKYKLPADFKLKSARPYEVRWGEQFLNTLLPNAKKPKGILKQPDAGTKPKPRTRFSQATVYYFERIQPYPPTRRDGKITLSMERFHFYSNHLPLDVFEDQKEIRQQRNLAALTSMEIDEENRNWKLHLNERNKDKDIIVHTIQVPVELMEEDVSIKKVVQNKTRGCGCNAYCDPDICECNLNGMQCEVFKDNFPCGCQLEFCRNTNGRVAYNNRYVHQNFVSGASPAPKAKQVKCGRINKRKQLVPVRYRKF